MFLALAALPCASAAQDTGVTQDGAIACMTFEGLRTFWMTVDQLPADVDGEAFKASLQCLSLAADLTFIKLGEINDGINGLQGMLAMNGETFEVWLADVDLKGQ